MKDGIVIGFLSATIISLILWVVFCDTNNIVGVSARVNHEKILALPTEGDSLGDTLEKLGQVSKKLHIHQMTYSSGKYWACSSESDWAEVSTLMKVHKTPKEVLEECLRLVKVTKDES